MQEPLELKLIESSRAFNLVPYGLIRNRKYYFKPTGEFKTVPRTALAPPRGPHSTFRFSQNPGAPPSPTQQAESFAIYSPQAEVESHSRESIVEK